MFLHILEAILNSLGLSPLVLAGLGAFFGSAEHALENFMKDKADPREEGKKDLKAFAKGIEGLLPDAEQFERIQKDVEQQLENVKSVAADVFKPTGQAVGTALSDGQVQAQGDGGLGKTAEDFTQGGNIPGPPIGDLPGISTEQTGLSRSGGGDSGGGSSGGGSGSSGGTTRLGGSGSGTGASGTGTGTQPPTAADLGIDP